MSFLDDRAQQLAEYYTKYDARVIDKNWDAVDTYLTKRLIPEATSDPALIAAFESHSKNNLPLISVNPTNGKLLYMLALSSRASRILEIGTLAGYSTLWLAKALSGKDNTRLVTLEFEEKHAEVARQNFARAGLQDVVQVIQGDAQASLKDMIDRGDKFDFIFIDADKPAYPKYLDAVMQLAEPGTLIVADNVVRQGAIVDEHSKDEKVCGAQQYIDGLAKLAAQGRITSTGVQTVDAKGHDGFAISMVL